MKYLGPKSYEAYDNLEILQCAWSDEVFEVASKLYLKKYKDMSVDRTAQVDQAAPSQQKKGKAAKGAAMASQNDKDNSKAGKGTGKASKNDKDPNISEFLLYFKNTWLGRNRSFYEGFAPGVPSTNNALESFNGMLKKDVTDRELLCVGAFTVRLVAQMVTWSKDHSANFQASYTIPPILYQEAWRWARAEVDVLLVEEDEDIAIYPVKEKELPEKPMTAPPSEW